ncbi:MAG: bacterioferritin-associated ferredoxin [Cognaticolwellia sp.]|jgi:bacterioferritin-associated ferredoxin
MDEQLLQRFRDGDPGATVPLRNQLRTLAARVLAPPQWGVQDSGTRAGLERDAAQATLASGANTAVALTEEVLAQAGAQGIGLLRSREPHAAEGHPAALEIARVASSTASAVQLARVNAHTQDCGRCRKHLEILKAALRAATTAQRGPTLTRTPTGPRPETRPRPPRPKSARRRDGPSKAAAPKRIASEGRGLPWLAILGGVAVLAGIVWRLQPSDEQIIWARAELLPTELPPTARADLYSGPSKRAISELRDGSCRDSATTLHLQAKGSGDAFLHWYEGVAWVCARDGAKALEALDQVSNIAGADVPWGYGWWRAQALVLAGQDGQALVLLDELAGSRHARAGDASALAGRIRGQ